MSHCLIFTGRVNFTMLLYLALVVISFVYFIYCHVTRTFNYWKDRNVAGPKPVPLFGNLKELVLRRQNVGILYKDIYDSYPNEKVVGIYRMTTPCLLIRDLDVIKHIMIKDFDVFADRGVEFSKEGLGANLFHADGDTWRILRNRFTPLFTSGKIKNMLYLMVERGDNIVDYINSECAKQPEQEVHSLVQKYTMATIAACAFGLDIDLIRNNLEALKKIDKIVFTPNYAVELDMMYPGIFKKLNCSLVPPFLKNFFANLVNNVITQRNGVPSNRNDFMDLILELRQEKELQGTKRNEKGTHFMLELTEDVIASQAFVFYAAGYETSATTLSYLLYELAMNPDVQDKLAAEIDEVLEKYHGQVTYESLQEMRYLEPVFSETLRMHSIVEPLQRNAKMDYHIPDTDIVIKKGQTVLVSPLGIHHDEKYYPNPEKFDPDRFSPEQSKDRHSCAFMAFGVGPRNCIGIRFGKFQSRVFIVKFLSKFRVEPSENTMKVMEYDPNRITLSPKGGMYLNIVPRK